MRFTSETNANVNLSVAGPYLIAFGVLLLVALAARVGAYYWVQSRPVARVPIWLGPYDVALLTGDSLHVVETALAYLADAGAVVVSHGRTSTFRRGSRADQQAVDSVQQQVLDLLTKETSAQTLARKFSRTGTAAQLRQRLVSGGYHPDVPDRPRFRLIVQALVPIVPVTMFLVRLGLGIGSDENMMLLTVEVTVSVIVWMWCENSLPLKRTRWGERTKKEIGSLADEHETGEKQLNAVDRQNVQQLCEAISTRAEEWNLSPGWIDSAPGIVPFIGWKGTWQNDPSTGIPHPASCSIRCFPCGKPAPIAASGGSTDRWARSAPWPRRWCSGSWISAGPRS